MLRKCIYNVYNYCTVYYNLLEGYLTIKKVTNYIGTSIHTSEFKFSIANRLVINIYCNFIQKKHKMFTEKKILILKLK